MSRPTIVTLGMLVPGLWLAGCATKTQPTTPESVHVEKSDDRAEPGKADASRQIVYKVQGLT